MGTGSFAAFRRVWLGATVSAAGDAASWIALVALTLGTPNGSVAVLAICYTAPVAAGGLAAGWALDRFDRRRLLIADASVRAAVFALIPLSALTGGVPLPLVNAVAAVYGLLKIVSLAGFPAVIPQLVDPDQLPRANALEGASYGLASLAGAGLGGLVIGALGQGGAVGLVLTDALSYLAFAAALHTVRLGPLPAGDGVGDAADASVMGQARTRTSLMAVIRLAATRPVLRTLTAMFALFNIGEGMLLVFLPHRSAAIGLGTGGYGYLVAALTGGELAAAALLARRDWTRPLVPSILIGQLIAALIVVTLIVPDPVSTLIAMAALGFVSAPMTAWAQTLRMREAPAAMHGRLFALLRTVMQATPPAGAALAAGLSGGGPAVLIGCAAAIMGLPVLLGAADLRGGRSVIPHAAERRS